MTLVGLLGIRFMFSFKNIVASTSLGLRDDYFGNVIIMDNLNII